MGLLIFIGCVIVVVFLTAFTVKQQQVIIIERFGKFHRMAGAGLNFKIPLVDTVSGDLNMRIQQLDVHIETKTKDNVFVTLQVSVQFFVKEGREFEAFYKLDNTEQQITAYVFDSVRARVPQILLDDVFEKKDEIADSVQSELADMMNSFGYGIQKALVTDIEPDSKVKAAMNEINTNQRLRVAAEEKGEADKILVVKAAEAEADSKALQGKGIANQRKAIVDGLKDSIEDFQTTITDTSAQDVMMLVLMTQYFDTLKDIGATSNSNTILMSHSPGALSDLATQMQESMIVANEVSKKK